ncbi:hypothetical protein DM02DRAFT_671456 [Periconia macrospinosa]|uniref:Uncharacterized protein n=1 Tax=Periconia macrospinosa TaxID=97972 RepID=A0A2V1DVC0_9PLEO|nr:hypothetical protein DM02DRAFT_671456 [Periconia macrospinosa]
MGVLFSTLNLFLPFTNPQTPLLQDLIHTSILCGTLYFAPQIAEHYRQHNATPPATAWDGDESQQVENAAEGAPVHQGQELEPDGNDGMGEELEQQPPAGQRQPRAPPPAPHVQDEGQDWPNENDLGAVEADIGVGMEAAGPANERPRPTPANRTVGTKKAKSLARKDQRRAYHEFHRSQAEQRRLAEEAGREERERILIEEKSRRAGEERRIAEKVREERDRKKEEERREVEEERGRRERTVSRVRDEMERKGVVDLGALATQEGKDRVWIERLVRASGIMEKIGKDRKGSKVFITGECWLVKLEAELVKSAYADAVEYGNEMGGKISFARFGEILQKVVLARAHDVA